MPISPPSPTPPAAARLSAAATRNGPYILDVLRSHLPARASVLEIASGSGQHAAFLSAALPDVRWTPSDPDAAARDSIDAWRATGPNTLAPALNIDASDSVGWPPGPFDAVVCINMIHISPWTATEGLMALAAGVLPLGGLLYLYGPYLEDETPLAPSNAAFDVDLKRRNPDWGLKRREAVEDLARTHGLIATRRVEMPANNLSLLFRRV